MFSNFMALSELYYHLIVLTIYFCTILFLHYFLCTYLFLSTSGVRDRFFFVVPTSELSIFPLLVKLSMTSSIILYAKINQLQDWYCTDKEYHYWLPIAPYLGSLLPSSRQLTFHTMYNEILIAKTKAISNSCENHSYLIHAGH